MSHNAPVHDSQLERQGWRMLGPGLRLIAIALVVMVPGIVLVVLGHDGLLGLGIALLLLASVPGTFGLGLLASSSVARWAARHKLFA